MFPRRRSLLDLAPSRLTKGPRREKRRLAKRADLAGGYHTRLGLEHLEDRRLLAVVGYNAGSDALTFTGDAGEADNVQVKSPAANTLEITVGNGDAITLADDAVANADFVLSNGDATLTINVAGSAVADLTVNGGDMDDTLTVDFSGGPVIPTGGLLFNGGTQAANGDSLVLQGGGPFATVSHTFTNANAGTVDISTENLITYAGLEPIADNLNVANRVFTFTNPANNITLTNVNATLTQIDSNQSESVDFTTPTNSLTVNLANGTNTVSVNSLAGNYNTPTNAIVGGTGADTVNFEVSGTAASNWTVTGAGGTDGVNLSPVAMDLDNLLGPITFNGGGGVNTLDVDDTNDAGANTYTVTSTNIDRATFGGVTYDADVQNVNFRAGTGSDTINVTSTSAAATTTVSGGTGGDTFNITANALAGTNVFNGENDNDTFNLNFAADTTITAAVADLTVNGGDMDDTLTVDFSGGPVIPTGGLLFNGGTQAANGDSLVLQGGGPFATVSHTFTNANAGTVDISTENLITYAGLEPIADNLNVANRVFTFTNPANNITLTNVNATLTQIDSNQSESVDFTTPTNSLTVNLANGTNTVSVNSLAGNYNTPTNAIVGGTGADTVNFEVSGTAASNWTVTGAGGTDGVNLSPVAMDLDNLLGPITFNGGGGVNTLDVDDTNDAGANTYTVTSTNIDRATFGGVTYDADVQNVNFRAGTGSDTINVTSTSAAATTTVSGGTGGDTFNITANALAGTNVFNGENDNDTFNLNFAADTTITAAAVTINGNGPAADTDNRDVVNLNAIADTIARTVGLTYSSAASGDLNVTGFGTMIDLNTVETFNLNGAGANDAVTVTGTAANDNLTVAPLDVDEALVFIGGNPWDGPPDAEAFANAIPGVGDGGNGPDMHLSDIALLSVDGGGGTMNHLFVYGTSEANLVDAGTTDDLFGFGAGVVIPGSTNAMHPAAPANAFDEILVTDTAVRIVDDAQAAVPADLRIPVSIVTASFVQPSVLSFGLTVNAGFEANPPGPVTPEFPLEVADDIVATISNSFSMLVNGGDPPPTAAPDGDRLHVNTPNEINVFSDKSTPPVVSVTSGGPFSVGFSSIEFALFEPGNGQVNLLGDNNDPAVDQNDNFIVLGQDVDDDGDGANEFSLRINGDTAAPNFPALYFNNVTDLNVFGDDAALTASNGNDIDTLEITPYADDTPLGWGIDVFFNEGNPSGTGGAQADLIILHTSLLGGEVSENIEIRPSGPDNGEIIVTNASDGSLIMDLDYVANTDIIIIDDDGALNDTDTVTLWGTDGTTPQTSGNETFAVDFDAAGMVASPQVTVSDTTSGNILYRLRSLTGIEQVNFNTGDGNDDLTFASPAGASAFANGVEQLNVTGGLGNDTVTYNVQARDIGNGVALNFDGNQGADQITISGTPTSGAPAGTLVSTTYNVGANEGDGQIILNDGAAPNLTIDFQNLEPVVMLVPAATLIVNANGAANQINYTQGSVASRGLVSIDGHETVEFANKTNLTINALGGSDLINLNHPGTPTGLNTITVNAGDPTANFDTVVVNDAVNGTNINVTAIALGGAMVTGAQTATVTVAGAELLRIDGQGGNDMLSVQATAGQNNTFIHTPGFVPDSGQFEITNAGAALLPIVYHNLGGGTVTTDGNGGTDTLVARGTGGVDTFAVSTTAADTPVIGLTTTAGTHAGLNGTAIDNVTIEALGDNDTINVAAPINLTGTFTVEGGDSDAMTDVLNLTGQAGTNESVVIAPLVGNETRQRITGLGTANQDVGGVELIVFSGNAGDTDNLNVELGTGVATARVQSANNNQADEVISSTLPTIQFEAVQGFVLDGADEPTTATFAFDELSGAMTYTFDSDDQDTLVIEGRGSGDQFTASLVAANLQVSGFGGVTVNTTGMDQNDLLRVETLGGDDTLTVNVGGTALINTPIFFDGGTGSDLLTVTGNPTPADNNTRVSYTPGQQPDEGRLAYDDDGGVSAFDDMLIDFDNLEPVVDLVNAASLTVNGDGASNAITYAADPANAATRGLVSIDGFEVITFNNKVNLTINAMGGDDTVVANNTNTPTGLTTLTVGAGDGADEIRLEALPVGVTTTANGDGGDDVIDASTLTGPTILNGGAGNDTITGGAGADTISGGTGDDTFIDSAGVDTYDGGTGNDMIVIRGTILNDVFDVFQLTPSAVVGANYQLSVVNGPLAAPPAAVTNNITTVNAGQSPSNPLNRPSVEGVRVEALGGDDIIRVGHHDEYSDLDAVGDVAQTIRYIVEGDAPNASDRLLVRDHLVGDLVIHRVGADERSGSVTVGRMAPVDYSGIEFVDVTPLDPITGRTGGDLDDNGILNGGEVADGRLVVFKNDPFEANNSLPNATFLGAGPTINVDPTIDPGGLTVPFPIPGDNDFYEFVAQETGTLDFQLFFEPIAQLGNGRAGLPGDGELVANVYDDDGTLIGSSTPQDILNGSGEKIGERITVPVVIDETYFVQVIGETADAINVYNFTAIVTTAPVPQSVDLQAASDTGESNSDNITFNPTPTFDIVLDDARIQEFLNLGLTPDNVDDNLPTAAFDYGVEVFNNAVSIGFAFVTADPNVWQFTAQAGDLNEGDNNQISAAVWIADEADPEQINRGELSVPLQVTLDTVAPIADAPNLLDTSDSGMFNDDNVTHKWEPAFDGEAEVNNKVFVYATLVDPATELPVGNPILIGSGLVGSDLSNNVVDGLGIWEVTVEPIVEGVYDITVRFEDWAGNFTPLVDANNNALRIVIDKTEPNTPLLDLITDPLLGDTGRHDLDNITRQNQPVVTMTSADPNVFLAEVLFADNLKFRIFDRYESFNGQNTPEFLLYDSAADAAVDAVSLAGDMFTSLTLIEETLPTQFFTLFGAANEAVLAGGVLADGIHNLKLEVEDRAGNISHDFLLDIVIDTVAPPVSFGLPDAASVIDGLAADSDNGVTTVPATFADRVTNDTTPRLWGRAEANTIVQVFHDRNANGMIDLATDDFLGQTVALPFGGNDAYPDGYWEITSVLDLNQILGMPKDGLRRLLVTAEDVAGNPMPMGGQIATNVDELQIFIDTQGPQVTDVRVADDLAYDLFDPKPSVDGPSPLVNSLRIDFRDLPNRLNQVGVTNDFLYEALIEGIAETPGNYLLVGDHVGTIAIDTVVLTPIAASNGNPATAFVTLTFAQPLPDDRFTLTILDNLVDPANNNLDGESNASQPLDNPTFPSGDGVPGGNFVARFTIDTRPEIGTFVATNIDLDINGNFVWDPANGQIGNDATNVDLSFTLPVGVGANNQVGQGGYNVHDIAFAGKFLSPGAVAPTRFFDQLAAYGNSAELGAFRWILDTNSDGIVNTTQGDILNIQPAVAGFNIAGAIPVAGNFDLNLANGDEIGLYYAGQWALDSNHNFVIDAADTFLNGNLFGRPIVGDFDGNGVDDLGVFNNNQFFFDLNAAGFDGNSDTIFVWGFPGVLDRPVAADMDQDGIDDIGLWVPRNSAQSNRPLSEWYFLVSGNPTPAQRAAGVGTLNFLNHPFETVPFGNDLYAEFGDELALPIVGNFDPPVADTGEIDQQSEPETGDFSGDGSIDGFDFLSWQRGFGMDAASGTAPSAGNGDGDYSGAVDGQDLSIWAATYGEGDSQASAPQATADFTGDGIVNGSDFLAFQRGYRMSNAAGTPPIMGDGDGDLNGVVDGQDLAMWLGDYGQSVSQDVAGPADADFDGDGAVGGSDLSVWQGGYGTAAAGNLAGGDANQSGTVDGGDFLAWQRQFDAQPVVASAAALIEPEEDAPLDLIAISSAFAARLQPLSSLAAREDVFEIIGEDNGATAGAFSIEPLPVAASAAGSQSVELEIAEAEQDAQDSWEQAFDEDEALLWV